MADNDVLTVPEVAAYLRIGEESVRTLVRQKRLYGVKVGKSWRFYRADVEAMLRAPTAPTVHEQPK
jgi:excisionase family DNA binding protein